MDFYVVEVAGEFLSNRFTSLGDAVQACIDETNPNCVSYIYEAVIAADGATEVLGFVLSYRHETN